MRKLISEAEVATFAYFHEHGRSVREAAKIVGRSKSALHVRYLDRQRRAMAAKLEEDISRPIDQVLAEIFEPESTPQTTGVTTSRIANIPNLQDRIRRFVAAVFKAIGKGTRKAG